MKQNHKHPAKLRLKAEAQLAQAPGSKLTPRPAEELLHELRVYQIQLEMQNENLRQSQVELETSRDRYVDFYDFSPVGYLTLSHEAMIEEINLTGATLLGIARSKLLHSRFASCVTAEDRDHWHQCFQTVLKNDDPLTCELELQRGDGSRFYAQLNCLRLGKAAKTSIVRMVMTDITERKAAEDKINNLAFYDSLTQLPNRRLLNDRLGKIMASSKRTGHYGALMFLDLDNFKPLNDAHGHGVGDLLLAEVAHRIARCIREADTVARFGGDEFVIALSELDENKAESASQAAIIAGKIRTTLAEPYVLKFRIGKKVETRIEHRCTSSIGVVLFVNHEASAEDILKWTDMAMYQAKEAGRNQIQFYESET